MDKYYRVSNRYYLTDKETLFELELLENESIRTDDYTEYLRFFYASLENGKLIKLPDEE